MRILLTSGGTGGHIYATVAVARALQKISDEQKLFLEMIFVGPDDFSVIKNKKILAGKLRRYFSLENFVDFFKIIIGFWQAFWQVFWYMPDIIFGKGGYGSFPVLLVGILFKIPILIHESDSTPGLTNKILAPFAKRITFSFPESEKYFSAKKRLLTGHPIREEVLSPGKQEAGSVLKLVGDKPAIFFIGGSQGAKRINDILLEILPDLLKKYEVLHQCGENNFKEVKGEADAIFLAQKINREYYHLYATLSEKEMGCAYVASDLIIARAGAGTIFEIAAQGKPSILIPLPTAAGDHQVKNAYEFSRDERAIVFEEANFTPHFILQEITNLLENKPRLAKMGASAKKFSKPDAVKTIAKEIIRLAAT